jgi:hypothetical protein
METVYAFYSEKQDCDVTDGNLGRKIIKIRKFWVCRVYSFN